MHSEHPYITLLPLTPGGVEGSNEDLPLVPFFCQSLEFGPGLGSLFDLGFNCPPLGLSWSASPPFPFRRPLQSDFWYRVRLHS